MVNVFLPYADYEKSIRVLDKKRLTKQLVECIQLLAVIVHKKKGYANHPVTKIWRPYVGALVHYAHICCLVIRDKYPAYSLEKMEARLTSGEFGAASQEEKPVFSDAFHDSHKSSLWHKDPEEYHMFEEHSHINCYAWPVPVKRVTIWKNPRLALK